MDSGSIGVIPSFGTGEMEFVVQMEGVGAAK